MTLSTLGGRAPPVCEGLQGIYMTVSGSDGGFVYSFEALGAGIRQSNGG
jgi:lactonase